MINIKENKKCVENFVKICTKVAYEKYGFTFKNPKFLGKFDYFEDAMEYMKSDVRLDDFNPDDEIIYV